MQRTIMPTIMIKKKDVQGDDYANSYWKKDGGEEWKQGAKINT